MHVLFLTDNFPPETNAPASRTFEHAREWVKAGHRVTVITCAPNFPSGKVFDGYRNRLWQSEEIEGIRVIRVWTFMTSNEGFALRILDYLSFMLAGFIAGLFVRKPGVVVGTSPQFFTAVAAWGVAVLKRRPFVFELRDIWPETIRAVGAMGDSRVLDMLERLELFLYRRAAAVVSVTRSFKRNLVGRGIDGDKIHIVTNGVDASQFHPTDKDPSLVADLGLEGRFVAGYIGTLGMCHALDTLLDAAAILQDDPQSQDIRILFLGDGAARGGLLERAGAKGLRNVIFRESVPRDAVPGYWSILDVALVHLRKTELFTTVIPSKIFECLGMGIPIVLGVEGEAAEIVRQSAAGVTIEPENAVQLSRELKRLSQDQQALMRMSAAGRAAAHSFDRGVLARSMLSVLQDVSK